MFENRSQVLLSIQTTLVCESSFTFCCYVYLVSLITHFTSLNKINRKVEALDQLRVLDPGDKKLRHLHFQEVGWQLSYLVLVNLELDAKERGRVWADLEHSRKAEECHAVKHNELLFFE